MREPVVQLQKPESFLTFDCHIQLFVVAEISSSFTVSKINFFLPRASFMVKRGY